MLAGRTRSPIQPDLLLAILRNQWLGFSLSNSLHINNLYFLRKTNKAETECSFNGPHRQPEPDRGSASIGPTLRFST